jgi:nucleotide-binding universal stress UspA family protein
VENANETVKPGGKILVGWDGSVSSNAALDKAVEMAKKFKATITVLYTYYDSTLAKSDKMMEQVENAQEDEGTRIFRDLEGKLNERGVDFNLRTDETNDKAKAILQIAEDEGYDLIVVGAGVKRSGSLSDKVSAGKKVPVLIV